MRSGRGLIGPLLALVLSGCTARVAPEPSAIGQLVPLSGPERALGEQARNGARLAVELLKQEAELPEQPLVVRHVDTRGNPETVRAEAVRLVTLNRVAALLGGPDSAASEQLARTGQSYGVPVLLTADLPKTAPGDAVFCLGASLEARGRALALFAARELHCSHVVIASDARDASGTALATAFTDTWKKEHRDKEPGLKEWSWQGAGERAPLAQRVTAARPEAVLIVAEPAEFLSFREQLAAGGLKSPLLYGGTDVGSSPLAERLATGPAVYLSTVFTPEADSGPEGQDFVRQYREKFGARPGLPAAMAYDGVRVLASALTRAKGSDPTRLRDALLATTDFAGVTGPVSLANRRARRRVFVASVADGATKVVRAFGPEQLE